MDPGSSHMEIAFTLCSFFKKKTFCHYANNIFLIFIQVRNKNFILLFKLAAKDHYQQLVAVLEARLMDLLEVLEDM